MSLKVLHVIPSFNAGGAESLLKNLARESQSFSKELTIEISYFYKSDFHLAELKKSGVKIFFLNSLGKYDPITIFRLVGVIRNGNYNIVHVHLFPSGLITAFATFFWYKKRPTFVYTEHDTWNRRRKYTFLKVLDLFMYHRYKIILCVSENVRKKLINWLPSLKSKTKILYNAIPFHYDEKEKIIPEIIYDLLFVGRLEPKKGVDVLFRAVSLLQNQGRFLRVGIIGDGVWKDYLRELGRELKIEDQIAYLGFRNDVQQLLKKTKIFVLPSRWEGFGLVLLEAMAARVPIVASRVDGIREIIDEGENGLLVEPENPKDLAGAVERILDDKELSDRFSIVGFEKVKKCFTMEIYLKNLIAIYKNLIMSHDLSH